MPTILGSSVGSAAQSWRDLLRLRLLQSWWYGASLNVPGNAATPQTLFAINNGSTLITVVVTGLTMAMDSTAAQLVQAGRFFAQKSSTLATGGTAITKVLGDSQRPSDVGVTVMDSNGVAIVPGASLGSLSRQWGTRQSTLVGERANLIRSLLPIVPDTLPLILRPGESAQVFVTHAAAADNAATNIYAVNISVEEWL